MKRLISIIILTQLTFLTADNYSLSFDGTDDYVSIVELSTAIDNSNITLMGWFKSTSNGEPNIYHEGIFGFRNYPSSDGNYYATMNWTGWTNVPTIEIYGGVSANIPLTPSDDTWYHLALVYDNTNSVFSTYLDGLQMASNTATNDPIVPNIDLLIGNNIENGNHFFKGYIDDISLWSTALSQEDIQSYRASELTGNETGLVGYWNFNEGSGTTLTDQTSNDNNGTITGATWNDDGAPVTAGTTPTNTYSLSFDGTDDFVGVPSNSVYTVNQSFTIETWINANSNSGTKSIAQGWYGYGFQLYMSNGAPNFILREPNGNGVGFLGTTQIGDGSWHHIAAVLDGTNVSVFVDGSLDLEGTFNNTVTGNGTDDLSFGHSPWASEYYNGLLDEIRIWNVALTESQIQSYRATELTGNETGLVGYWNFNEGTGTTLTDLSGNGNHGTINGATWNDDGAPLQPTTFASLTVDTV